MAFPPFLSFPFLNYQNIPQNFLYNLIHACTDNIAISNNIEFHLVRIMCKNNGCEFLEVEECAPSTVDAVLC